VNPGHIITAFDVDNDLQAVSSTRMSGHPLTNSRIREESSNELNPAKHP